VEVVFGIYVLIFKRRAIIFFNNIILNPLDREKFRKPMLC
jgi:hypothetical protein